MKNSPSFHQRIDRFPAGLLLLLEILDATSVLVIKSLVLQVMRDPALLRAIPYLIPTKWVYNLMIPVESGIPTLTVTLRLLLLRSFSHPKSYRVFFVILTVFLGNKISIKCIHPTFAPSFAKSSRFNINITIININNIKCIQGKQ